MLFKAECNGNETMLTQPRNYSVTYDILFNRWPRASSSRCLFIYLLLRGIESRGYIEFETLKIGENVWGQIVRSRWRIRMSYVVAVGGWRRVKDIRTESLSPLTGASLALSVLEKKSPLLGTLFAAALYGSRDIRESQACASAAPWQRRLPLEVVRENGGPAAERISASTRVLHLQSRTKGCGARFAPTVPYGNNKRGRRRNTEV